MECVNDREIEREGDIYGEKKEGEGKERESVECERQVNCKAVFKHRTFQMLLDQKDQILTKLYSWEKAFWASVHHVQ